MGIKHLNRYIQTQCKSSIKQIHLSELTNKKIVIDTSIYLYRYASDNTLLENFYLMISIFRQYNIIPLFIFDGKPPKEKKDLLKKRREAKQLAENKFNELKQSISHETSDEDKSSIINEMELLKKEFVKINHKDIENVKELLQAFGVSYIEAEGEADKLCAKIVSKNKAYACLSEDMDMFVYGCNRVLRYLSLLKKSVIIYDTKSILSELKLNMDEFKSICIVSCTDYNVDNDQANLHQTLKYFKKYKKSSSDDFYTWLESNTTYASNIYELYNISNLFDLQSMEEYKKYETYKISNAPINLNNLKRVMEKEDFIFIH